MNSRVLAVITPRPRPKNHIAASSSSDLETHDLKPGQTDLQREAECELSRSGWSHKAHFLVLFFLPFVHLKLPLNRINLGLGTQIILWTMCAIWFPNLIISASSPPLAFPHPTEHTVDTGTFTPFPYKVILGAVTSHIISSLGHR